MSYDTGRIQVAFAIEAAAGTEETISDANADVYWYAEGQASYDIPKEAIGRPANATFQEGELVSGQQSLTMPDIMADFRTTGDPSVEPKVWKYLAAFGMKVDGTTNKRLYWDGTPSCTTLTGVLRTFQCDDAYVQDGFRGGVGTLMIGADGPNSQIKYTLSNATGPALREVGGSGRLTATGQDTGPIEIMADYAVVIGSQPYAIQNWSWEINADINPDGGNNAQGIVKHKQTGQAAAFNCLLTAIGPATESLINDNMDSLKKGAITFTGTNQDIVFTNFQSREVNRADSAGTLGLQVSGICTEVDFTLK